jgi:pimeloyl-ACP methyl ester carboxylesterase
VADATAKTLRTVDGRALCFADWGPADGYPVFSLHGSPGCRLSIRGLDQATARGCRLITYDRPGNGRSDRMPGRCAADCVADVQAVADALGLDEFAVVGGSAGSHHALAAAARLPGRVSRVAAVGAIAPLVVLGWDEWSRLQDEESIQYLRMCAKGGDEAATFLGEMDAEMRAGADPETPEGAEVLEQTRNGVWGWVDDELACQISWGFEAAEVTVPAAIWSNPRDTVTPPNHAEWLVDAIASAFLVSSDNAPGHAEIADPDTARSELYAWLVEGGG